jgi:hypothetical protein
MGAACSFAPLTRLSFDAEAGEMDETYACRRRLDPFGLGKVPTPARRCRRLGSLRQMRRSPSRTDDVVKMLPGREAASRLVRL